MNANEFEQEIGKLLGETVVETKPEPKTIGDTVRFVPSTPATTVTVPVEKPVEKPKAERKLRQVDEGKVDVTEHAPRFIKTAHLYSKGYVRLQWPQSWNAVSFYRRQLVELIQWARSEAADKFLQELDRTGKFQD